MKLSFDDEESFKEIVGSLRFNNPPSDLNSNSSRLPIQEDIYFNISPSDPNSLGHRVGSMPPQEKGKDIDIIAA